MEEKGVTDLLYSHSSYFMLLVGKKIVLSVCMEQYSLHSWGWNREHTWESCI